MTSVTPNVSTSEASRLATETHFEIGFEQSAVAAVHADLQGRAYRVNPAMCRLLARPAELLTGRRWTEYSHPDDVPLGQQFREGVAAGRDTYQEERRYLRPDGSKSVGASSAGTSRASGSS